MRADLLRIGDYNPADVRSDYCGNRSRIAGGFDDDNVATGELVGKFFQWFATHDDTTQPAELAVCAHARSFVAGTVNSAWAATGRLLLPTAGADRFRPPIAAGD